MINAQLIPYGTTLAQPAVNPLSPASLAMPVPAAGGPPQVAEGKVTTEFGPTKEYKTPGAGTQEAMDSMDLAYQSKLNAMDVLSKAAIQKEEAQAKSADQKAKIAEEIETKRKAMEQAEEARKSKEAADRARALDEFEKTSRVTTLFDDMTPLRRFMSAIAVAGGQWAATMSGGQNGAYQIFKDAEENHRRIQEANIKKATERVMNQTKSAEEARKYFETSMEHLDKTMLARQKVADLQLAAIEKSIPEAAARAQQARAEVAIDYQKGKRDYLNGYDVTTREPGTTTQTSTGDKSGGQQAPDSSTKQAVITARETQKSMSELGDFIKKNPDAWAEYQKAALADAELEAAKQGNEKLISGLQGIGAAKVAIDQRLQTPEARKINAMIAPMITAKAREMDPIGALNKDAYINASKSLNLFTGPAEEVAGKAYEYADKNGRIADEYVRMTPALQRQEQVAPAQPTGKVGSPHRARGIPPEKQEAAISAADDFVAIRDAVKAKKTQLNATEQADTKEALETLKKNPTDAEAARYLRELRQRKGI